MSVHEVKVINLNNYSIIKHPNADSLSLIDIFGYTACVRTEEIDLSVFYAYIEPDYVVPDTEQFAFLKGHRRIKCKKLRGIMSHGLLIKAPEGLNEGDNAMEALGVVRYEPPMSSGLKAGKQGIPPPDLVIPVYDLEPWRKNKWMIQEGDHCSLSEKIHGSNAKYLYFQDKMWVGSRTTWREYDDTNTFWQAIRDNPWIEIWCKDNPGMVLFGEIYGKVQDLRYGMPDNKIGFRAFDVWDPVKQSFWTLKEFDEWFTVEPYCLYRAPVLYEGPFNQEVMLSLIDGKTVMPGANHIREGIVIKSNNEVGRIALKVVSDDYLSRQK
jgi:RNA ligase (TIGR02306 family)